MLPLRTDAFIMIKSLSCELLDLILQIFRFTDFPDFTSTSLPNKFGAENAE